MVISLHTYVKNSDFLAICFQDASKTLPRRFQGAPRRPKKVERRLQGAPRHLKDAPRHLKTPQDSSKMAQAAPKTPHRCLQDAPRPPKAPPKRRTTKTSTQRKFATKADKQHIHEKLTCLCSLLVRNRPWALF